MTEPARFLDSADELPRQPSGAVVPRRRVLGVVALSVLAALGAFVTMGLVWASVPAEVAWQWELDGTPSTVGPAWTWWLVPLLGAGIGVTFPLIAAHVLDPLGRVTLATLGAGIGVLIPCMAAQVIVAQAGADPAHLPQMANVFSSLAVACAAAALAAVLIARTHEPR